MKRQPPINTAGINTSKKVSETTPTKKRKIDLLGPQEIEECQSETDLNHFTCDQLRSFLKSKHINEKGLKVEIVQRVFEFLCKSTKKKKIQCDSEKKTSHSSRVELIPSTNIPKIPSTSSILSRWHRHSNHVGEWNMNPLLFSLVREKYHTNTPKCELTDFIFFRRWTKICSKIGF